MSNARVNAKVLVVLERWDTCSFLLKTHKPSMLTLSLTSSQFEYDNLKSQVINLKIQDASLLTQGIKLK